MIAQGQPVTFIASRVQDLNLGVPDPTLALSFLLYPVTIRKGSAETALLQSKSAALSQLREC